MYNFEHSLLGLKIQAEALVDFRPGWTSGRGFRGPCGWRGTLPDPGFVASASKIISKVKKMSPK
jgi:hypothetical protein